MRVADDVGQAAGELWHTLLELVDRLLEVGDVGLGAGVELVEQVAELLRLPQVDAEDFAFALGPQAERG